MFCPECGKTMGEGVVFCTNCGAKLGETLQAVSSANQAIRKPMGVMFIVFFTSFTGLSMMLSGAILNIAGYMGLGGGEIPLGGGALILIDVPASKWGLFWTGLAGYFMLFIGIFNLVAAYGLWNLTEWGRRLAIVLCIIAIFLSFFGLIVLRPTIGFLFLQLIWMAVLVAMIFYLSKPDIKTLFQ